MVTTLSRSPNCLKQGNAIISWVLRSNRTSAPCLLVLRYITAPQFSACMPDVAICKLLDMGFVHGAMMCEVIGRPPSSAQLGSNLH